MDIFTFLALVLIGYLAVMVVLGSIVWCAVRLWRRRTGKPDPLEGHDPGAHRHQRAGTDVDREIAESMLRSHPGPLP